MTKNIKTSFNEITENDKDLNDELLYEHIIYVQCKRMWYKTFADQLDSNYILPLSSEDQERYKQYRDFIYDFMKTPNDKTFEYPRILREYLLGHIFCNDTI